MNLEKSSNKDLYYTKDHEWIDYQGSVAYVGVCSFKLLGFREVHQIIFNGVSGFMKQGEVIASVKYNDYRIDVHMPVDGKLVQINDTLVSGNQNILLQQPENSGWVALIVPTELYERKELLLPKQYQINSKNKYAK